MKIIVGSTNQTKIVAVQEAVTLYPTIFPEPQIIGREVNVDLYGHPKNIEETVAGAIARAKQAYGDCGFSFGLEGGLLEVPHTTTGFMEVGACAIYDGQNIHLGLSPAYEWPLEVTKLITSGKADASQAFKQLGLTEHEKLGAQPDGIVGWLTNGRIKREDFTKYSIIMAMIQFEHPQLYSNN